MVRRILLILLFCGGVARGDGWANDRVWNDGLVEKATYSASRLIYGKAGAYEAIFFTNKEHHDRETLTKADNSTDVIEVWKHNQVEVVPTPNYDYKFLTTTHLATKDLQLTRLDASSQEFCGTSFKQYWRAPVMTDSPERFEPASSLQYFSFSYMPEAGRHTALIHAAPLPIVAEDSLPLWLRNYDFAKREAVRISLLPTQKSNRPTDHEPLEVEVRFVEEQADAYVLSVQDVRSDRSVQRGTFWMAKDRLHVMLRHEGVDGQRYELKQLSRVNYWTITGE